MADKTKHPLEAIEGVIKVKDAPKPTEDELREKLVNEAREHQKNRNFIPPKHSGMA